MSRRFRSSIARLSIACLVVTAVTTACSDDDTATTPDPSPTAAPSADATSPDGDRGCAGPDPADDARPIDPAAVAGADLTGTTITLVAYDSFLLSDDVLAAFEDETGASLEILTTADTGTMVSQAVLTAGDPVADVLWGIDNTFLCRGIDAGVFMPYESPLLDDIPDELELDPTHRVTPVDVSDLCVNIWTDALVGDVPTTLEDLADPGLASQLVTENPETSAPGMGLLLSTIATFGEDGWEDYWRRLADGGLTVTSGWSEAYYGEFVAGGGDKAMVMSYATSPVAELVFATEPLDAPPTTSLDESCYRSVEFAGVLAGTDQPLGAARLVDFLASRTVQDDIPLTMFVYPANERAELPPEFIEFAPMAQDALMLDPGYVEANRDDWTERWTEIVLR